MLGRVRVFCVWPLISRRATRRILSVKRLRRLGIRLLLPLGRRHPDCHHVRLPRTAAHLGDTATKQVLAYRFLRCPCCSPCKRDPTPNDAAILVPLKLL
jgi:hypothetical protein